MKEASGLQPSEKSPVVSVFPRAQRRSKPDDSLLSTLSIRRPWPVGQGMCASLPRKGCSANRHLVAETNGLRASARPLGFGTMRDRDTIDSELRLIAAVRRTIRDEAARCRPAHRWTSCSTDAYRAVLVA
jgi:hypothetical protein